MGLLSNLFVANVVNRENNQRVRRRNHVFDTVSQAEADRSIFVFGGREDNRYGRQAVRIRQDIIDEYVDHSLRNGIATIVLCACESMESELYGRYCGAGIVRAGRELPWQLFDARNNMAEVRNMFEEIIWAYCGKRSSQYDTILAWIDYLLDLLFSCLGPDYFTFQNLHCMVSHLTRVSGERMVYDSQNDAAAFLSWMESCAGFQLPMGMRNSLAGLWKRGISDFQIFWSTFLLEVRTWLDADVSASVLSFNDVLREGGVCICTIPDAGKNLAAAALLAQLQMIRKTNHSVRLVDDFVRLPQLQDDGLFFQLGAAASYCIVGRSPREAGVDNRLAGSMSNLTVLCMGMSNLGDVKDISDLMSGKSLISKINWCVGREMSLNVSQEVMPDLSDDRLRVENCPDGQAVIRDANGYRIVRFLLT